MRALVLDAALLVLLWALQRRWAVGRTSSARLALAVWGSMRLLGLLGCVLAAYAYSNWRADRLMQTRWPSSWHGLALDVEGVVVGVPQITLAPGDAPAAEVSRSARASVRVVFRLENVIAHGQDSPSERDWRAQARARLPQDVVLTWSGGLSLAEGGLHAAAQDLLPGQRWRMRVVLRPVHGLLNPGAFDQELWWWSQGVHTRAVVRAGWQDPAPVLLQQADLSIDRLRQQTRQALQTQTAFGRWPYGMEFEPFWRARSMGIVAALAVGDQRAIAAQDWAIFRETGVAHLVSISGMHITLFAALGIPWLGWLWRQTARCSPVFCSTVSAPIFGLWGGIGCSVVYALFSGWAIPAQRTAWMLVLAGLLKHLGVAWPWWVRWLSIATVMALFNPWALLQAGFWLSFIAVAILLGQHDWPKLLADAPDQKGLARWWSGLKGLAVEQLRMAWVLAPLSMLFFAQVSVSGLVANILAVPWMTMLVTPLSLLGTLWPLLWEVAALLMLPLLLVLEHMAEWPMSGWSSASPPWPVAALSVLTAGWWMQTKAWRRPRHVWLGALVLPALLWHRDGPARGEFEVTALDVGQGNALVVRTQHHVLVYDTGPISAGERVVLPWLAHQGLQPNRVIVSHSDSDHSGGVYAVLDQFPGAQVWASVPQGSDIHRSLQARASAGVFACKAPLAWTWDGVVFEIMHPAEAPSEGMGIKPNASSCVLRVTRQASEQGVSVLLTADIEMAQEALLTAVWQSRRLPPLDVLLVPHHGSATSSSLPFLKSLAPRMAWVQAGVGNLYGHPVPSVMQRYRDLGIAVYLSSSCGTATWQSVKPAAMQCYRRCAGRYWHRPSAG